MSSYSIRVLLDRPDATFHNGEPVSGALQVTALRTVKVAPMALVLGWRTHGYGNIDRGEAARVTFDAPSIAGDLHQQRFSLLSEPGHSPVFPRPSFFRSVRLLSGGR